MIENARNYLTTPLLGIEYSNSFQINILFYKMKTARTFGLLSDMNLFATVNTLTYNTTLKRSKTYGITATAVCLIMVPTHPLTSVICVAIQANLIVPAKVLPVLNVATTMPQKSL